MPACALATLAISKIKGLSSALYEPPFPAVSPKREIDTRASSIVATTRAALPARRRDRWLALAGMLQLGCRIAAASGLVDQGFTHTPVVRTDYVAPDEGTAANPLTISDCHYGQNPCPALHSVFSQSNAWSLNWPAGCMAGTCPNYWTLTINNEVADSLSNPGPPDVSLPYASPGTGLMAFNALYGDDNFPGDTLWRAHLILNFWFTNPQYGGNPFLGIGAFAGHGNPGYPGMLNPSNANSPSVLRFDARLWEANLPQPISEFQQSTIVFWVQVFASWGPHPKAIQIALFHQASGSYIATPTLATIPWDWRYMESAYYPGAIFVSTRAEDLRSLCGIGMPAMVLHEDVHYELDLQRLFQCMSDRGMFVDGNGHDEPLPSTADIPVTIVNWADEGTGVNGSLWTDVHSMTMTSMRTDGIFANGVD